MRHKEHQAETIKASCTHFLFLPPCRFREAFPAILRDFYEFTCDLTGKWWKAIDGEKDCRKFSFVLGSIKSCWWLRGFMQKVVKIDV